MEIDLAILADAATIDATGKLNILGVFDRIQVSKFPAQFARIALILRLATGTSEIGTHQMDIKLVDPGGREILSLNGEIQLGSGGSAEGGLRVPHILNIDGLVFPAPGIYGFDVKIDQKHHVTISLFVNGSDTN